MTRQGSPASKRALTNAIVKPAGCLKASSTSQTTHHGRWQQLLWKACACPDSCTSRPSGYQLTVFTITVSSAAVAPHMAQGLLQAGRSPQGSAATCSSSSSTAADTEPHNSKHCRSEWIVRRFWFQYSVGLQLWNAPHHCAPMTCPFCRCGPQAADLLPKLAAAASAASRQQQHADTQQDLLASHTAWANNRAREVRAQPVRPEP